MVSWGQRPGSAVKSGLLWCSGIGIAMGLRDITGRVRVESILSLSWKQGRRVAMNVGKVGARLRSYHSSMSISVVDEMLLTEWQVEEAPATAVSQQQHQEGSQQWRKQFRGIPNLPLSTYLTSNAAMRESRGAVTENCGPIPYVLAGFLFNLLG